MAKGPVRRSQLIAPFGVGAMLTNRDGISLISCGLDHWFEREDDSASGVDEREFIIREWRLERLLGVSGFRCPPDYRSRPRGAASGGAADKNYYLTVPFLRFPQWHYCPDCRRMMDLPLTVRETRFMCPECKAQNRNRVMVQVPFVAVCEHGHIQDFPWREWAHSSATPGCSGALRYVSTGGATLGGQKVVCDACGASRTLEGITLDGAITNMLQSDGAYPCSGISPWLGYNNGDGCGQPLRGSLRSASNVYYARVRSALYVPQSAGRTEEILALFDKPDISTFISIVRGLGTLPNPDQLKQQYPLEFEDYNDDELAEALDFYAQRENEQSDEEQAAAPDNEEAFRRVELQVLRTPQSLPDLQIRSLPVEEYGPPVSRFFSQIQLVEKLRETRALAGFTRIYPENDLTPGQLMSLLRREPPSRAALWLPAYVVRGEGVLLQLREDRLQSWLDTHRELHARRLRLINQNFAQVCERRRLGQRTISARLVLLHTLSHVLINQLTFECGYSSASLRERLYVSDDADRPMAAVLIYTAAGDAEGTMGGLVRMGRPGSLEPLVERALDKARWCSADPVCMELGDAGGQGPDSCNLAACHNCALVPETACEEFNRFLDRSLLVGSSSGPGRGYFSLSEGEDG